MTKKKIIILSLTVLVLISAVCLMLFLPCEKQFKITGSALTSLDGEKDILDYVYDENGRLLKITSNDTDYLTYEYSDNYRKVKIFNHSSGNEKIYTFNDNLDIIKKEYPENFVENYVYDDKNNLVGYSNSSGVECKYIYDGKKIISEVYANGDTIDYEYVKNNVVSKAQFDNGIYMGSYYYHYDGKKLIKESSPYDQITYTYDNKGRLIYEESLTGAYMNYTYDDYDNFETVSFSGMSEMSYKYEETEIPEEIYKMNNLLITYNHTIDETSYPVIK